MSDETDFGDVLITEDGPVGNRGGEGGLVNVGRTPTPRYVRTGETADTLAYQCAIRLLRGESWVTIESSLAARGVGDVDKIMELAARKIQNK